MLFIKLANEFIVNPIQDPESEREFRQQFAQGSPYALRWCSFLLVLAMLVTFVGDAMSSTEFKQIWHKQLIRLTTGTLGTVLFYRLVALPQISKQAVQTLHLLFPYLIFVLLFTIIQNFGAETETTFWRSVISYCLAIGAVFAIGRENVIRLVFTSLLLLVYICYRFETTRATNPDVWTYGAMAMFITISIGIGIYFIGMSRERQAFLARRDSALQSDKFEIESRSKTALLAGLSHDLRQPMTSLVLYTKLIQRFQKNNPNATLERYLNELFRGTQSIQDNLANLLEIAQVQDFTQNLSLESVDLYEPLLHLKELFRISAQSAGSRYVVRVPQKGTVYVLTNRSLLERILSNLAGNAIKYSGQNLTGRKGRVLVDLKRSQNEVVLEFKDNGIGIDPEFHLKIFEIYFQLNNQDRNRDNGFGMGLSFVQEASKRLGHQLVVDSQSNGGSNFQLVLERCNSKRASQSVSEKNTIVFSTSQSVELKLLKPVFILLIEDEASIKRALTELLTIWSAVIENASDLSEATTKIANSEISYDLVITDYKLANEVNGIELIHTIRSLLQFDIPAILMTGDNSINKIANSLPNNTKLLRKPIQIESLHQAIVDLTGLK
jgi:signal transduction histidine kinase/CheY-like chemotaxis protein